MIYEPQLNRELWWEDMAPIYKRVANEPLHEEYLTEEMVLLMLDALRKEGKIIFGGGWRGTFGESYINIGTWTPTIAADNDPIIFARKSHAAHILAERMKDAWDKGIIQGLIHHVYEEIKAQKPGDIIHS